ncbi:MAG: S1 RNA-binding domain-containing protein [Lachnospiraceae bacterium]|nr:S1 RNA-binding domain-containing protein [Lachnospiraceae bacterium]
MTEEIVAEETMMDYERELEASFRKINEGDVISGTVIDVNEEEVTLDLKYYTQGIIKAKDMSADPGFAVLEEVHEGDVIEAIVVKMDDGQGNILLSKKEANAVLSWDILNSYLQEKKDITVKVSEAVNAGVVAYVEGIRGFIPASQLDMAYVEDVAPYVGKKLTVRVTALERAKERLILSAKEVLREKEKEAHDHKVAMIVPGTVLEGTVESLQTYGAFVDLKDGLSGLVHISQISQKRIKKPSEVLKAGDKVKVKVLNTNDGKISLSIKAVEEEQEAQEREELDTAQFSSDESVGTSLGDLFKNLGF